MPIILNEYNQKAMGGTELLINEMNQHVDQELLSKIQLIPGRFRGVVDDGTIPVFWIHDTCDDPEMAFLANGGWSVFKKIVFVSYWQMNSFIMKFGIPHSVCVVIPNAVPATGFIHHLKADKTIRLIYHTTPHRGLVILNAAFKELSKHYDVHLDVFSSFKIYGWEERDKQFQDLYDDLQSNKKVTYHGTAPYDEVRTALKTSHIFAYPCIWQETGCRSLIEANMDGALSVHPDYSCLPETAHDMSSMYRFTENPLEHLNRFYSILEYSVNWIKENHGDFNYRRSENYRKSKALFSWDSRKHDWNDFFQQLIEYENR